MSVALTSSGTTSSAAASDDYTENETYAWANSNWGAVWGTGSSASVSPGSQLLRASTRIPPTRTRSGARWRSRELAPRGP